MKQNNLIVRCRYPLYFDKVFFSETPMDTKKLIREQYPDMFPYIDNKVENIYKFRYDYKYDEDDERYVNMNPIGMGVTIDPYTFTPMLNGYRYFSVKFIKERDAFIFKLIYG